MTSRSEPRAALPLRPKAADDAAREAHRYIALVRAEAPPSPEEAEILRLREALERVSDLAARGTSAEACAEVARAALEGDDNLIGDGGC